MPYLGFTKLIINHFLSQHKFLAKLKHSYINIIKDDGVLNRLKFVRTGEDFQEYGRAIPDTMLIDEIKQSEAHQTFLALFTGLIPYVRNREKTRSLLKDVALKDECPNLEWCCCVEWLLMKKNLIMLMKGSKDHHKEFHVQSSCSGPEKHTDDEVCGLASSCPMTKFTVLEDLLSNFSLLTLGGGLKNDEERLENELYKLESSYGVLVFPCDVTAKERRKEIRISIVSDDPSYVTGGEPEYPQELFSAVDLLFLQFLGASCTQRKVSMVSFGRISPNSFLSSILLVVVIIVTVVIVVVILIVVVVAIIGVVIVVAIFGVVVINGTSLGPVFLLGLSTFAMVAACASRVAVIPSVMSCWMAAKVMAGVSDVDVLLGGILST
ncbi:hypothetical protein Tco_0407889 [Tanacetum coccineum]